MIFDLQKVFTSEGSQIPILYGIDSVHGANYIRGATLFPQQISLAFPLLNLSIFLFIFLFPSLVPPSLL